MQKNKITIISRNEYENADIETQSKQFFIEENKIHYENKLQIMENKQGPMKGVNVVNNLCRVQKNSKLTKTTYIYFEDKVIKIEDEFYLESPFRTVKVDQQIYPIKKPIHLQQPKVQQNISNNTDQENRIKRKKKDLKNIVKNIVKIFIHWLHKYPKKEACFGSMKKLLDFNKYNNSLIRAMSEIPEINEAFSTFLATESRELVESSRIHDKPTHLEKLKKYESLFGVSKKNTIGMSTSGNGSGSNEGNSSENKNGSGSDDKQKFSMNQNEQNNQNNMNGQKMFTQPNGEMNSNINNSKASDSDKLFNSSNNGSNNGSNGSGENDKRGSNRTMGNMANVARNEEYARGERITNRENQLFFSSSGSDQC